MNRIRAILKAIYYQLKYRKSLHWSTALRCERISDLKITSGDLTIGKGFSMNPGSYIAVVNDGKMCIGNNVTMNRNTIIVCHESITIGNHCSIGPNVLVYDHDHCFDSIGLQDGYRTAPVVIKDNCWIGGSVTILRGTTIGEGCVIGAGSVVKGNIPPHSLVTANRELRVAPLCEGK